MISVVAPRSGCNASTMGTSSSCSEDDAFAGRHLRAVVVGTVALPHGTRRAAAILGMGRQPLARWRGYSRSRARTRRGSPATRSSAERPVPRSPRSGIARRRATDQWPPSPDGAAPVRPDRAATARPDPPPETAGSCRCACRAASRASTKGRSPRAFAPWPTSKCVASSVSTIDTQRDFF